MRNKAQRIYSRTQSINGASALTFPGSSPVDFGAQTIVGVAKKTFEGQRTALDGSSKVVCAASRTVSGNDPIVFASPTVYFGTALPAPAQHIAAISDFDRLLCHKKPFTS